MKTSAPQESLAGLVERITFFNEENGFVVARIKVKGRRDLVTLTGNSPAIHPGEWVRADGKWVHNREHGTQFEASLLHISPPMSSEGIEKYLGSGLIHGIGPVYAKKLVAHFGEKVLDIIDNYSARLAEVDGIGPKRRKQIKESWQTQKAIRAIMLFLYSNGVSTSRAVRIYKTYGEQAVQKIQQNPYRLAHDIHGIGFASADQIARRMGFQENSPARLRAGLLHVLQEQTSVGHCAMPRLDLLSAAANLLKADQDQLIEPLQQLLKEKEVIEEDSLIFPKNLLEAEQEIATQILERLEQPSPLPPIEAEKAIAWVEQKTGKTLAQGQKQALELAFSKNILVITGGPGVGKSTLLESLLKILKAKKVRTLLCAPTGRAARRMAELTGEHASTIHRLLGKYFEDAPTVCLPECNLLIADECSMIDVPLFYRLLKALPMRSALVLIGDVDQLPSVGPGLVFRHLIESGRIPVARLTEVFRQTAGSQIVQAAHQINSGLLPEKIETKETDFYLIERNEPEAIQETLLEIITQRLPKAFKFDPMKEIQVLTPMNRGLLGTRELNALLQKHLNPIGEIDMTLEKFGTFFRPKDKVIQTMNNYDRDVFNGDVGQIESIDTDERVVYVKFDEKRVAYLFEEMDELQLAYAMTVHKSQGSEFPAIVIPLSTQHYMLLQRNLLYTAVTRGKRLVVLIGQTQALQMAVKNAEAGKRYSRLVERLTRD